MKPIPLYYLWDYSDVDRAFWAEHLEGWLPERIIDAHVHLTNEAHRTAPGREEEDALFWVGQVSRPMEADVAERCIGAAFPERDVKCVAFGAPSQAFDTDAANEYTGAECAKRGWWGLAVLRPEWTRERVAYELDRPGIIGLKPYYSMISGRPEGRDDQLQADIFDYLPHHALEVANERRAWITLHVSKTERLPHPNNIRQVKQIRERYPDIVLVVAHLGRCYTEPHAREGLAPLADDPGLYFDISAVLNPAVLRLGLELFGPRRLIYGTDSPVFYMRGRRQWDGRCYINRTNGDFEFNKGQHEAPEIETGYTLYIYEQLRAIKNVCTERGVSRDGIGAIFHDNATRLVRGAPDSKAGREEGNGNS